MKPVLKEIIFHFITFLFVIVISIAAVEIAARYLVYQKGMYLKFIDRPHFFKLAHEDPGYQFEKEFYLSDPRIGWKHTPNNHGVFRGWRYPHAEFRSQVAINAQGYRDTEDYEYVADQWRIAVLGDSFIQAVQVEQNEAIPELLESGLKARGINSKIYNFGVSSIGTIHQYQIFRHEVLALKPDVLVLSFFPNDLVDNSPSYKHERPELTPQYDFDDQGNIQIQPFDIKSQEGLLLSHPIDIKQSDELNQATRTINRLRDWSQRFPSSIALEFLKLYMIDRLGLRTDYDYPFDIYRKEYPKPLEESFDLMTNLMSKFQQDCRREGIELVVMILPAREQVHPQYWQEHVEQRRFILSHEDFDLYKPNRRLKNFLEQAEIPYLDLMPNFLAVKDTTKLFYDFDHHFNAAGHAQAASVLIEYLEQLHMN